SGLPMVVLLALAGSAARASRTTIASPIPPITRRRAISLLYDGTRRGRDVSPPIRPSGASDTVGPGTKTACSRRSGTDPIAPPGGRDGVRNRARRAAVSLVKR